MNNITLKRFNIFTGMSVYLTKAMSYMYDQYGLMPRQYTIHDDIGRGMHPLEQVEEIKAIISRMNDHPDMILIAGTHSPYVLTALNVMIIAHRVRDKIANTLELLPFDDLTVWEVKDNAFYNILDQENKLIITENLDKVSKYIEVEFNTLLDLLYEEK